MATDACKHRVFVAARDVAGARIVALAHPRLPEHPLQVMRTADALLEVQRLANDEKEPRSWLMAGAERVQQDGTLFLATPIHPVLLLLPRLRAARGAGADNERGYFRPLSDVASGGEDDAAVEAHVLTLPGLLDKLRLVCDVNDKYDEPMVRLSDEKLLGWLRRMTEAVRAHLSADALLLKQASAAAAKKTDMSQFDEGVAFDGGAPGAPAAPAAPSALAVALAFVCEYLAPETQRSLCAACDVGEEAVVAHRGAAKKAAPAPAAPAAFGSTGAAVNRSRDEPEAAPAPKKAKAAPVAKAAKLAQQPLKKGQSTMMGFFKK